MVFTSRNRPLTPNTRSPATNERPLPRSNTTERTTDTEAPSSLLGRTSRFVRNNERAAGAILLGTAGLGALTGCATSGAMARTIDTPTNNEQTPEALWNDYQTKVKALETKASEDGTSHADLLEARRSLYTEYVANGGTIGIEADTDGDGINLAKEILFGTSDNAIDSDGDKMSDAYELSVGLDPADKQLTAKADIDGWTHGYIPMSKNPMIEKRGMLFYDMLIKDRTGEDPGMRFIEGRSAMDGGHYFLSSTLDEADAEMTTGKDFNGDGVLTPGVKWDFLKPTSGEARFDRDGKTDETLDVGWWGHCNDVAVAGIKFQEPTQPVTFPLSQPFDVFEVEATTGTYQAHSVTKGDTHTDIELISGQTIRLPNADVLSQTKDTITEITFSPDQIKELLSELVHRGAKGGSEFIGSRYYGRDATIELKDGSTVKGGLVSSLHDRSTTTTGSHTTATDFTKDVTARVFDFETKKWESKTFKAEDIASIRAENKRDVAPIKFHETMLKWIGSEKAAGVMDKDAGSHVWNYSFDRYELTTKDSETDANAVDYEMKVYFVGNNYPTTYNYSITYDDGVPTSGTWADSSPNPDFFWRHRGDHTAYDHNSGRATPINYDTVMELYEASIKAPTTSEN